MRKRMHAVLEQTTFRSLCIGEMFRFPSDDGMLRYQYRGRGWYGSVEGRDGGPWHSASDAPVLVLRYPCIACLSRVLGGREGLCRHCADAEARDNPPKKGA